MNTIKQRIKIACIKSDLSLTDLALKFGLSPSAFTQRLQRGKFTKSDLTKIAEILGCKYKSCFRFDDGFSADNPDIGKQIKSALDHGGMTITELGVRFGIKQQAMSKKMQIGKFTQDDLYKIAQSMDCEYISEFCYDDGAVL